MLRLRGGIATISRIESCFRDEVKLPNADGVRATGQIFVNPCFVYAAAAVISQFHEVSVSSVVERFFLSYSWRFVLFVVVLFFLYSLVNAATSCRISLHPAEFLSVRALQSPRTVIGGLLS